MKAPILRLRGKSLRGSGTALLFTLVLATGCLGEQFGGSTQEGEPAVCVPFMESELELNELSPLGFAPAELMAFLAGDHESVMQWGATTGTEAQLSVFPAPAESTILVHVASQEATYSFVDFEFEEDSSWADQEGTSCPDEVRVHTTVKVQSGNGAFDEEVAMVLSASQPLLVSGSLVLSPGEMNGSLDFAPEEDEDATLLDSTLAVHWTPGGGFSGQAWASYEMRTKSAAILWSGAPLLRFPRERRCEEENAWDLPLESAPSRAALSVLSEAEHILVTWKKSGTTDEFAVALKADFFCVQSPSVYNSESAGMRFRAKASRENAEGDVLASWLLEGTASSGTHGDLSSVHLAHDALLLPAAQVLEKQGLNVLGISDYDEAQLLIEFSWNEKKLWEGTITAQGRSAADPCAPDNLVLDGPIPEECLSGNVYTAGWETLDTAELSFE